MTAGCPERSDVASTSGGSLRSEGFVDEIAREAEWTEDLLTRLPPPICLVGNGASNARWGRVIDGYATVIRMNNFRLAGFEDVVGHRTDVRAVTGWFDVENRNEHVELSPFTHWCRESGNLFAYRARNERDVLTPRTDVHSLIPEVPNPSTGLALAQLFETLRIPVDLFGFDSFRTAHYWDDPSAAPGHDHSPTERDALLRMRHVQVHAELHGYRELYDYCHATHPGYGQNLGLLALRTLGIDLRHQRVLELGAGNGDLARFLESRGCRTTAVEVSKVAFAKIECTEKINGSALALVALRDDFDTFVSFDVLEHLIENDLRIVLRHAARLCDQLLVSVSTRPSGLLGPAGENLHETVRPPRWWIEQLSTHFADLRVAPGLEPAEYVITGRSRTRRRPRQPLDVGSPLRDRFAKRGYRIRDLPAPLAPAPIEAAVARPSVHVLGAHLARRLECTHVVVVGAREAPELAKWYPELTVIAVDRPETPGARPAVAGVRFVDCNLEDARTIDVDPGVLRGAVVVCDGVLERLRDPLPALGLVEKVMQHAAAGVLSSVDRDLARGPDDVGPPADPHHVREWSRTELCHLVRFAGLNLVFAGPAAVENASLLVLGPPSTGLPGALPPRSAHLLSLVEEFTSKARG